MANCQSAGQQLAECRAYAIQQGYQIVESFIDEGKSRNDFDRPGLLGAIKSMRRGWKLVAVRPDRVGSGQAFGVLVYQIEKRGGVVEFASGEYNGDDPARVLVRSIMSHVAEYERAMIGIKTSAGMLYRQGQGERMTHIDTLPIGMQPDPENDRKMVPKTDEQAAIKLVRRWNREGVSVLEMVRRLNASRYKPRGKKWHRTTVRRIIERANR